MMFHSVSDLSQASLLAEDVTVWNWVAGGQNRARPPSKIFTPQGRRAVIQLGFCVLANSRVRCYGDGRSEADLSLSLSLGFSSSTYNYATYAGKCSVLATTVIT